MRSIPYGRQSVDEEDIHNVTDVLRGDWLTTGPKVPEFENTTAQYLGCRYAIAVNSGTSALDIAIQTLALEKNAEIITTPFTFAATSNSILYNGHKPVYADIIRGTRNLNPDEILKKITPKTRAVIIVDYAGQPCDLEPIQSICRENDLILIEDACHALGASYHGKKIGTTADMTVFSFHPVKAITTGEGGMVVTDNEEYAKKLSLLRTHGIDRNLSPHNGTRSGWEYDMVDLGRNYRMTDIQAALGISQIKKLDNFITRRNELADLYLDLLSEYPFIELPQSISPITHAWHLFTVLVKDIDRNAFFRYMRSHGVGVNLHYIPSYRLKYYREHLPCNPTEYPVTEEVYDHIISLPMYPRLTEEEIHFIADIMKNAFKRAE